MTNKKIRVGLLFGGQSGEHEVSLTSAQNVMAALDKTKYDLVPIGISKTGQWLTDPNVMAQLKAAATMPPKLAQQQKPSTANEDLGQNLAAFLDSSLISTTNSSQSLDVIFPVLHGPLGEDGTVQGFLELADIPYVGCGVTGSAVAMDKAIAKDIFQTHSIPIVPHRVILRRTWKIEPSTIIGMLEQHLQYPMFAKPANLGSSVGITKATNRTELRASLNEAARYDRKIVIEQGINAREIEVSILGNDTPQASVPGEVIPSRNFYSYAAKYIDDSSELLIPAPLTAAQTEQIQTIAITAFQALDCAGLARVDFLMDNVTDEIYLNEINTMPGFTAISMYPKLWAASGLSYPKLVDKLIELAFERYQDKTQTVQSFDLSQAA